jgi:transposase
MRRQGAWANIRAAAQDRPADLSPGLYLYRNLVERFFHKFKHYRAIAT